jgi:hypothetical protein
MLAWVLKARRRHTRPGPAGVKQGERLAGAGRAGIGHNMDAKAQRSGKPAEHGKAQAGMDNACAKWRRLILAPVTHRLDLLERGWKTHPDHRPRGLTGRKQMAAALQWIDNHS